MENENRPNEGQAKGKPFNESSPEEVRDRVKETVQKGVAAVAGAIKGFSEEARRHDLAKTTKQAIQKAGETAREVAGTARQEIRQTREHLKGGGAQRTSRPGMGMGGSPVGRSPENEVPDLRKTEFGTQRDIKNAEEDFGE
jgi:hypothetical protein